MKHEFKSLIIASVIVTALATYVYASTERVINVAGTTSGWMGSGVCFEKGDKMTIAVSGSILHSSWDGEYHGPEGNPSSFCGNGCKPYANKCNVAALVGKIGSSSVRCVGTAISGVIQDSGELKFAINDTPVVIIKVLSMLLFKEVIYVEEVVGIVGKIYKNIFKFYIVFIYISFL